MIYGFCFLSCSLVVVRKIDGVEAGYAWKDEKHPCCGGAMQSSCNTRVLTKAWSRRPGFFLTAGRMNKIC